MSIHKPNAAANLGPRTPRTKVSETFRTVSDTQTKPTHRIPEELHRRFKRVAFDQERPMGEIVVDLIRVGAHEADMPKTAWRDTDRSYAAHRVT